jgi:hypothetical protein
MDMKAFEITTKMMVGEDVTEEEKSYARNYNDKYSIVRHLVMEKFATDKSKELKNFHFTPGEDFMKTPTVDVVNSIVKMFSELGNAKSVDFGDGSWDGDKYHNPPKTGRVKTKLGE